MQMLILAFLLICEAHAGFSLFKRQLKGPGLRSARDIYVYTPPGYEGASRRYPVIYMHDGQNLFDPARAFMGRTWQAQKTLDRLITNGEMAPVIVIAIDNTSERTDEYTFDFDSEVGLGGKAAVYLKFITDTLMPLVNQHYQSLKGPQNTAMVGSSLGGLMSLYAGVASPEYFGLVGALSPSLWWNEQSVIELYGVSPALPLKIWLDSGTTGGEKPQDVLLFEKRLKILGFNQQTLRTMIDRGAGHNESAWATRLPQVLKFLFPPLLE